MPFRHHESAPAAAGKRAPSRRAHLLAVCMTAVAIAAFAMSSPAQTHAGSADGSVPDAHIDKLRPGTHWAGPTIGKDTLLGKVVLVELWGS